MNGRLLLAVACATWAGDAAALSAGGDEPGRAGWLLAESARLASAAGSDGTVVVEGRDGWLYFAPELRHLGAGRFWGDFAAKVSRATDPAQVDPLPAILDFKAQLDRAGIELILVPVPPKAAIYPENLPGAAAPLAEGATPVRADVVHEEFYALLRAAGVDVLDLTPEFLARKAAAPLYCRQDTHWSGAACEAAAGLLASEIRGRPWYAAVPRRTFVVETKPVELSGDLWRELKEKPPKETLPLRFVGTPGTASPAPVPPDRTSPVVLLGDSHVLIFHAGADMQAVGAGLPDQLAFELGFAVDVVAVRGSGATPARVNLLRRARSPGYLAGKKLVIWCFAAREFTETSGWARVPVVK